MGFGQFYIVRFLFVGYMFILQKVRLNSKRLSNDIKKLDITWISCDSLPAGFSTNVPRSPSFGVYISQLIRFARMFSNADDINNRNLFLTAKLLKQGYRYHKIRKAFSKFCHRLLNTTLG